MFLLNFPVVHCYETNKLEEEEKASQPAIRVDTSDKVV
jgi:hypothetical protein